MWFGDGFGVGFGLFLFSVARFEGGGEGLKRSGIEAGKV